MFGITTLPVTMLQEESEAAVEMEFTPSPPTSVPVTVHCVPADTPVALKVSVLDCPELTREGFTEMIGVIPLAQVEGAPVTVTGVQDVGPADCTPFVAVTLGA